MTAATDITRSDRRGAASVGFGAILAALPMAPFFFVAEIYYEPRLIFAVAPGLILILFSAEKFLNRASRAVILAVLTAVFLAGWVSAVHNYKETKAADDIIAENFFAAFHGSVGRFITDEGTIYITDPVYIYNAKNRYTSDEYPKLNSIVSQEWKFLGKINSFYFDGRAVDENFSRYYFTAAVINPREDPPPGAVKFWVGEDLKVSTMDYFSKYVESIRR